MSGHLRQCCLCSFIIPALCFSATVVTCDVPPTPDNMIVDGDFVPDSNDTLVAFGGKLTYTCEVGYVIIGDDERTCQADGTFSGTTPTCTGKLDVLHTFEIVHASKINVTNNSLNNCNPFSDFQKFLLEHLHQLTRMVSDVSTIELWC